jgi:hypothetical protein
MPNAFAYLVFFSWPLVAVLLFAAQPPARALAAAIIAGYLLLPERVAVDFPMIPTINKVMMINLTAALVSVLALRRQRQVAGARTDLPPLGLSKWLFGALLALTLATPFATVLTNGEPVIAGPRYIPGMSLYDSVSRMMSTAIGVVPFVLGMWLLRTVDAQMELLRVLVIAACAYACLALFEVRMSPQLSNWIYGFFPHSFLQHMRGGGFRPVVFLHHGLWLGIFLCMAVLAACTLWRQALRDQAQATPWLAATLWLALTLVLSRNLGATALMLLFAPVILFTPLRMQVLIAAIFAFTVLTFPMLRGAGLVPMGAIHSLAQSVNENRAGSLKYRFDNEDMLLSRANEKPLAGWGSWGRNRVYDPETGRDLSVTDGIWVITIGSFGWFGYLAQFGLLTLPLFVLAQRRARGFAPATAGLSLVTSTALIDLIPNATLTPLTWLAAGALSGLAAQAARSVPTDAARSASSGNPKWALVGSTGSFSPDGPNERKLDAIWHSGGITHHRRPRS